jgi:hypothetical protein
VKELERHRLVVGEPEALDREHLVGGRQAQLLPELGAGGDDVEREDPAVGPHAAALHVLGERRHGQ